jgi:poly(hydroxyalkanoate) granule-associated protein
MVYDIVRKTLLAGLGMQEKVKELVEDLVKKGELNEREGAKLVKEWMEKAKSSTEDMNKMFSEGVSKGMEKANIATKEDLDKLTKKVHQLTVRVKKLENEVTGKEAEE